jgi:TPR repeat protein
MKKNIALLSAAVAASTALLSSCAMRGEQPPQLQAQAGVADNFCSPRPQEQKLILDEELDKLSLAELTALADGGNTHAMVLLGLRYTPAGPGESGERPPADMDKTLSLWRSAAANNHSHAEYLLGVAYMGGTGVPKDEAEAALWFRRAADRGNPLAQFWFGQMLAKGRGGLATDWKAALPYFSGAAAGDVNDAFVELGHMYAEGLGELDKDYEKAAVCYRHAVRRGSQIAQLNLRVLIGEGFITPQEGDPVITPKAPPNPAG